MRRPRFGRIAERISALRSQQRFTASAVDLAARVVAADLAEAIGSRGVSVPKQAGRLGNRVFRVATGAVLCDSKLDRFQQILIAKRLGEELDRAALHGSNRHRDIGVAADEDNRQAQICLGQLLLKLEPALPGQPDVENQAPGELGRVAIEEFLDRGK